jgi:thiol:disulfide interchange protein
VKPTRPFAALFVVAGLLLALPGHAATPIDFPAGVRWQTWDEAQKIPQAKRKPMALLVFAHWCPHCRSLAPAFADKEVVRLSKQLTMVRQDSDEKPAWLKDKFGKYGGYVPRMFIVAPDGRVVEEITSGHSRYPYFYQASQIEALRAALAKAGALGKPGKGR